MMNQKNKGRPKIHGGRDPKHEILKLLPRDGKEITYNEWKKDVKGQGIGNTTFIKYRQELEKEGHIIRRVDDKSKPPRVYYSLNPKPFEFFPKLFKSVCTEWIPIDAKEHLGGRPREQYLEWLKYWLSVEMCNITIKLLAFINHAQSLPQGVNPYSYLETAVRLWILPEVKQTYFYLQETGKTYPETIQELIDFMIKHAYYPEMDIDLPEESPGIRHVEWFEKGAKKPWE
nr:hypothetical protein [Candidatus Freyarchaeota archaeon]